MARKHVLEAAQRLRFVLGVGWLSRGAFVAVVATATAFRNAGQCGA